MQPGRTARSRHGVPTETHMMLGTVTDCAPSGTLTITLDYQVENEQACIGCGLKSHCALPNRKTICISSTGEFAVGDRVNVDVSPVWIVSLSVSVYLVPVILMLFGAGLGAVRGDWGAVAGAGMGLAAGIGWNMGLNRWLPIERLIRIKRC